MCALLLIARTRSVVALTARIPPEKLIAAADKPRVARVKTTFIVRMKKPPAGDINAEIVVAIFERPGFTPTGKTGIVVVSIESRRLRIRASAPRIPNTAAFFAGTSG